MVVISCHILVHSFLHAPSCKKYPILIFFIQLDQVMMNNSKKYNKYNKLVCILEKIIKGMNIMFLFLKIWDLSSDLCAILILQYHDHFNYNFLHLIIDKCCMLRRLNKSFECFIFGKRHKRPLYINLYCMYIRNPIPLPYT